MRQKGDCSKCGTEMQIMGVLPNGREYGKCPACYQITMTFEDQDDFEARLGWQLDGLQSHEANLVDRSRYVQHKLDIGRVKLSKIEDAMAYVARKKAAVRALRHLRGIILKRLYPRPEARTLEEYRQNILIDECQWCGARGLSDQRIDNYDHDGGWSVVGFYHFGQIRRQWLSVRCSGCGHDWSLSKLGVPRQ